MSENGAINFNGLIIDLININHLQSDKMWMNSMIQDLPKFIFIFTN